MTETTTKPHLNGTGSASELLDEVMRMADTSRVERPDKTEQQRAEVEAALLTQGAHDEGNARCTMLRNPGRFLHTDAFGWLYYTGKYWSAIGAEAMLGSAATETMLARINAAARSGEADQYKHILSRCLPNAGRVSGAISQMSYHLYTNHDSFDADPHMLNCQNGAIDLRTGEIFPHNSSQRFTHVTTVDYRPDATYAAWEKWLTDAVGGNRDIVLWLQMAIGYSLTGHISEEILFYLFGPPRSGKGSFTETLLALLGSPLAKEVNFATFTAQRTGDSQNFDLAPLKPCRFVAASESNAYERFNEAKIKALTGGNEVYCAFKHRDHFGYRPMFKIWLSSNQPVNADPDDDAVWGRVRVIEFPKSHLGAEDKRMKGRMKEAGFLEGVLAWAIEGAIKWYGLGAAGLPELATSAAIKSAHRGALDNVQSWLDECCTLGVDGFSVNAILYLSYEKWCKENGVEPKKQKSFSQAIIRKGYEAKSAKVEGKVVRGFTGVKLA